MVAAEWIRSSVVSVPTLDAKGNAHLLLPPVGKVNGHVLSYILSVSYPSMVLVGMQ